MKHAIIFRRLMLAAITVTTLSSSAIAQTDDVDCVGCDDDFTVWSAIEGMTWVELLGMMMLFGFLITLVVMGIARYRAISSASKQSRSYESRVLCALFYNRVDEAMSVARLFPKSPLAVVVDESVRAGNNLEKMSASKRALHRAIVSQATMLKRGLWIIAAICCTSPVVALITALSASTRYASGPPLTLCFGLMIVVPAVWLYRGLSAEIELLLLETDRMSVSIVDQMAEQLAEQLMDRFDNQSSVVHHLPREIRFQIPSRHSSSIRRYRSTGNRLQRELPDLL